MAKIENETKLSIYNKPDDVILKYFQLISEAKKTGNIKEFANRIKIIIFGKAKSLEPWQLITKPLYSPFYKPKRKQLAIMGVFLVGF